MPYPQLLACLLSCLAAGPAQLVAADQFSTDPTAYDKGRLGIHPRQAPFISAPEVLAPMLQVNIRQENATASSPGSHIFIRDDYDLHDGNEHFASPLVLDADDMSVVYMNRSFKSVFDVRVQQNFNQTFLTFYGGDKIDGFGNGYAHVLDSSYREVHKVSVQGLSVHSDLHEFQLTGHGTALATAYEPVIRNLRRWGGSRRGLVYESVFQELNIETNEVLFTWRASEHVDFADSYELVGSKWDFFHINSIEKTVAGNYLVSSRHYHAIYLVNGTSGDIIWQLGGKKNQFTELDSLNDQGKEFNNPVLSMAWQHHARFYHGNENEITFFDNHVLETGVGCTRDCSRGLHIAIDFDDTPPEPRKTVRILHEYLHPQGLQAQSQGSVQALEGGNVFMGWGRQASFSEHTMDGTTVLDVQFSPFHDLTVNGLDNYRAYKMDWVGRPYWNPSIAVKAEGGQGTVHVSWNGATEVRSWALLASATVDDLNGAEKLVVHLPRSGFETTIPIKYTEARYVRAAALDADGNIIGSTPVAGLHTADVMEANSPITSVFEDAYADDETEETDGDDVEGQDGEDYDDYAEDDEDEDEYEEDEEDEVDGEYGEDEDGSTAGAVYGSDVKLPRGLHITLGLVMFAGLVLSMFLV